MERLIPLVVLVPLAAAALTLGLGAGRHVRQRLGVATAALVLALQMLLLTQVMQPAVGEAATLRVGVGGIAPPLGIELVADALSTLVGGGVAAVMLAVMAAVGALPERMQRWHGLVPLLLVMMAGSQLAVVTGDLFTLFVAIEIMLLSSTVLLAQTATGARIGPLRAYLGVNVTVSALFLLAIAGVYAVAGTVNLADLGARWPAVPEGPRAALGGMLLVVLGVKAAAAPAFSWLPASYSALPVVIGAAYSALLTKVAIAALVRVSTSMDLVTTPDPLLLWVASFTMLLGVLGAFAQRHIGRILSWHIVSQVGYMIFGLALFDTAGVAGAVLYIAHQVLAKAALFLVAGAIEQRTGTLELAQLGGLARTSPGLAWLFGLAAMTLVGIPPTSGFVAKLALVDAGVAAGAAVTTGVALFVSVLTMLSMVKIWMGAFWGEPGPAVSAPTPASGMAGRALPAAVAEGPAGLPRMVTVPAAWGLVAATGLVALFGGPLVDLTRSGAATLLGAAA